MENKDELKEELSRIKENSAKSFDEFPDFDLYMDQVLLCLSRQMPTENKEEQLTSSMINNYIKAGLLPRANGKRYTREHLAYLTIIAKLKQVLTIQDTKALIGMFSESEGIEKAYDDFDKALCSAFEKLISELDDISDSDNAAVAMKLAVTGYVYKTASEMIINAITE